MLMMDIKLFIIDERNYYSRLYPLFDNRASVDINASTISFKLF